MIIELKVLWQNRKNWNVGGESTQNLLLNRTTRVAGYLKGNI